jgi:hypothetical protein
MTGHTRHRYPVVLPLAPLLAVITLALALAGAPATQAAPGADPLARLAVQQAQLAGADAAAGDVFGYAVALDGDVAVVGAPFKTVGTTIYQGAAYIFTRSGAVWSQQAELTLPDGAVEDYFGKSVAIDGSTAVIGSPDRTVNGHVSQGAAYVYTRSGTFWSLQAVLTAGDGVAWDRFAATLALENDLAVVGAPGRDEDDHYGQGVAYVFTRSDDAWSLRTKLTATGGAASDAFGTSLAVDGTSLLVGAPGRRVDAKDGQGAAFAFTGSGASWVQRAELTAADGEAADFFGEDVALDGDTALIGAYRRAVGDHYVQGAAYVFIRTGSIWSQQAELTAADGAMMDYFGRSVSVQGNTALVGAQGHLGQGAAYVFTRKGTLWSQRSMLLGADPPGSDAFGFCLDLDGDSALIGSQTRTVGTNTLQGTAYVFTGMPTRPVLSKISPTGAKRGATVTLTGKYLGSRRGAGYVKFGKVKTARYVSWSATKIRVKVPAKAKSGKAKVTVTTSDGTSVSKTFTVKR